MVVRFSMPSTATLIPTMATAMAASLENLPYEILVYIFQELDRTTLRVVCLSSSHMNELATPLLYRDVSIQLPYEEPNRIRQSSKKQV